MRTKPKAKPAMKPTAKAADAQRIFEQVQKRAYELWEAGGCQHGNDLAHWMRAEQEIRTEQAQARRAN